MNCVICGHYISENQKLITKEMMFGTQKEFEYYHCGNCNALQIKAIPKNINVYYENYYTAKKNFIQINKFKKIFWSIRRIIALSTLYPLIKVFSFNSILHWAHIAKINKNSNILDVGCGNGDVLFEFSKHGFRQLHGIDPNLKSGCLADIDLIKSDLLSFRTKLKYDLIMFNHSFEHIYEHHKTLKKALKLLSENGTIIIRTPIVNKAFEIYKENWVQVDAPRHFIIHSIKSMNLLCEKNQVEVYDYFFDSTSFQFLGSEQFKKGIASYSPNSYKVDSTKCIFSIDDIKKYEKMAKQYNNEGLGDQVAFFIRKKR